MKKLIGLIPLVMLAFVNAFVLFCYAEPENSATLLPGKEFNQTIKRLVPGQSAVSYDTTAFSIKQMVQTGSIPSGATTGLISVEGTEPVIVWYDSGTVYYYTNASKIYMNEDSSYMFYRIRLTGLDLSSFDTSNVTNMSYIFKNCYDLRALDMNGWDTSNVTNMFYMFHECSNLRELDLSNWNTSNVTDMGYMFQGCSNLETVNMSGWDFSKTMTGNNSKSPFNYSMSPIKHVNLTNAKFGPSMRSMFYDMTNLEELILEGSDTSNVTDMSLAFFECYKLTKLDLSSWDTSNVTDMTSMFNSCSSLTGLDLNGWNLNSITSMYSMFDYCNNLEYVNMDGWDMSDRGGTKGGLFYETPSLKKISARNRKIPTTFENVISRYWSYQAPIEEIDVSGWDLSGTTSLQGLFADSRDLKTIKGLDTWDVSGVTNMNSMFQNCSSLTGLEISHFDTSKVTDMGYMFDGCIGLVDLNLSNWDTSSASNMNSMFQNCSSLTGLDLRNFDTSNVTNMSSMFQGDDNLATIYASNKFVTSALSGDESSTNMFIGDINLIGGNGTIYDANHIDGEYAKIDRPGQKGYFTYLVTLSFDSDGGTSVDSQTFKLGLTGTKPVDPTKTGNTFLWWNTGDDQEFDFSQPIFEPTQLYAKWQVNQYTITFDIDGTLTTITGDYGRPVNKPANPTKNGYTFKGWEPEIPDTIPAEDMTVKAKWDKNGSSGGGGGGGGGGGSSSSSSSSSSSTSSNTTTGSDNSNNTGNQQTGSEANSSTGTQNEQTTTGTKINEPEANTGSNIQTGNQVDTLEQAPQNDNSNTQDSSPSSQNDGKTYTPEFQQAYEFAKGHGITTMPTIQKADMNGKLTRIAMAKMLSQYAMNILGQEPSEVEVPKFNDVTDKQNSDYDDGVTLAYQLGIMGQNMPNNKFRPDDEVTRAEFATALSRMIYGTSDGVYKGTGKYYIHHMEKLVEEGIITKDDPKMKELRGYVMIMLMRSAK